VLAFVLKISIADSCASRTAKWCGLPPAQIFLPREFLTAADGLKHKGKEDAQMEETSLQGPVLMVNGKLTLMIPLEDGAAEFAACSRGISEVEGSCLKIAIPEWLAGVLRIDEGDIVTVSNWDGNLNIVPKQARVVQ
jgi:hypothetical protein